MPRVRPDGGGRRVGGLGGPGAPGDGGSLRAARSPRAWVARRAGAGVDAPCAAWRGCLAGRSRGIAQAAAGALLGAVAGRGQRGARCGGVPCVGRGGPRVAVVDRRACGRGGGRRCRGRLGCGAGVCGARRRRARGPRRLSFACGGHGLGAHACPGNRLRRRAGHGARLGGVQARVDGDCVRDLRDRGAWWVGLRRRGPGHGAHALRARGVGKDGCPAPRLVSPERPE